MTGSLYLSQLRLNTRSPLVIADLADVQQMHMRTLGVFPDILGMGVGREAHGVLWRVDVNAAGTTLIVQSRTLPRWSRLPENYCTLRPDVEDTSALAEVLRAGLRLRYRLAGNAVHHEKNPGGTRRPLGRRDQQIDWLRGIAERGGFRLLGDTVPTVLPAHTGYRVKGKQVTPLTIRAVMFDGHLEVTDPDVFWDTLRKGVGPGKAYGCGMISLGQADPGFTIPDEHPTRTIAQTDSPDTAPGTVRRFRVA